MAEQLKMLAAHTNDPNSVLSIHIGWLTTTCNSSSRESSVLFWPLWTLSYTHTSTHEKSEIL